MNIILLRGKSSLKQGQDLAFSDLRLMLVNIVVVSLEVGRANWSISLDGTRVVATAGSYL